MEAVVGGKLRNAEDVIAADHLIKLKRDNSNNVWVVIDGIIKMWKKKNPNRWKSYLVNIKDLRDTRKNEYGASEDKETGGYLRYTVDVPEQVVYMIRTLYTPNELPMSKEFWREFGRRYPAFRVAEKI